MRNRQEVSDSAELGAPVLIVQDSSKLRRKASRPARSGALGLTQGEGEDRPENAALRFILFAANGLYFDSHSWNCWCSVLEETCQGQSR